MNSLAVELIKFEINVRALSAICYLMLDATKIGREVEKHQLNLSNKIIYRNLTDLEKLVWREALLENQKLRDVSEYYVRQGIEDYFTGERCRRKGFSLNDNPYPSDAYGFERWSDGWKEQDFRMKEDEAYANCNEMTEWIKDVAKQVSEED